jgi:hypothetical protein
MVPDYVPHFTVKIMEQVEPSQDAADEDAEFGGEYQFSSIHYSQGSNEL